VTGRRGRRRKQPLDDLKKKRGFCKLKEEELARTPCRTGSERGYGTVVRQSADFILGEKGAAEDNFIHFVLGLYNEEELRDFKCEQISLG